MVQCEINSKCLLDNDSNLEHHCMIYLLWKCDKFGANKKLFQLSNLLQEKYDQLVNKNWELFRKMLYCTFFGWNTFSSNSIYMKLFYDVWDFAVCTLYVLLLQFAVIRGTLQFLYKFLHVILKFVEIHFSIYDFHYLLILKFSYCLN